MAALLWAAPGDAAEPGKGFYLGIAAGLVSLADSDLGGGVELSTDSGAGASGALGYRFGQGLRAEFEVGLRRNEFDDVSAAASVFGTTLAAGQAIDGDLTVISWMVNGFYEFPNRTPWMPYLGLGAGGASVAVESSALATDDSDQVLAYQGMAGVSYRISENVWARAGYRFFATGDATFGGTDLEVSSHNFELGLQIGLEAF